MKAQDRCSVCIVNQGPTHRARMCRECVGGSSFRLSPTKVARLGVSSAAIDIHQISSVCMYEGFRCKHLKDRKECTGCSIVLGKKTGSLYDPDIQHMPPGSIIPVPPGFMNGTLKGVSKDAPKTVNEHGGGQSAVSYGFDCLDPKAMFAMTEALEEGRKEYGKGNWKKISVEDHINHMLIHIFAYMAGDTQDDHLGHAMCRAMFAKAVDITNKERNDEDL